MLPVSLGLTPVNFKGQLGSSFPQVELKRHANPEAEPSKLGSCSMAFFKAHVREKSLTPQEQGASSEECLLALAGDVDPTCSYVVAEPVKTPVSPICSAGASTAVVSRCCLLRLFRTLGDNPEALPLLELAVLKPLPEQLVPAMLLSIEAQVS